MSDTAAFLIGLYLVEGLVTAAFMAHLLLRGMPGWLADIQLHRKHFPAMTAKQRSETKWMRVAPLRAALSSNRVATVAFWVFIVLLVPLWPLWMVAWFLLIRRNSGGAGPTLPRRAS